MISEFYEYRDLIEKFVSNNLSIKNFERQYWDKFQNEKIILGEDLFNILDQLYAEVDMYTENHDLIQKDPDWNISEHQLRVYAKEALDKLKNLEILS